MDPFESLPTEIVENIIFYSADFVGIESLLSVSPWVNSRIFQAQPRRITLDLINSNSITTMPEVQQLLRNVVIINNPSTHFPTSESCLHLYTNNKGDCIPGSAFDALPDNITTLEIFHIIHIAANIQHLACMCLYTMQQNFISAVGNSLGSAASQRAAEPIAWVEEYPVYWALWHLQHYSALRKAAKFRWGWPKESVKKFSDNYIAHNDIFCILTEVIWTVAAILADLGLHPLYGHTTKAKREEKDKAEEEGHEEESTKAAWEYPTETPIPFFASLELPLHQDYKYYSNYPIWSPRPVPDAEIEETWFRTPYYRLGLGQARMFRAYTSGSPLARFRQAWLDMRQIQPFRRIGVMLWNKWRMYSVGLFTTIPRGASVRTPDGDFVREEDFRLSRYDVFSRWLALVGKPPPDVGENWENVGSTLARYINPC